ncbi:hypothetical protein A3C96_00355 [Candidatus Uhrbacteria bacterium RIFCSPHIGHO2_02_FULL_60_10]|uniref:Uncharacterized protein n=1 Tax=Candidatus Uhrbacteria bacterium RIFCSPHIGHO2_02_FULL_60_10 TaxID=1802392 RepID=A0A1F7U8D3_9BACT|nr:MAG: hypothetical protein A3C96_00355 [Candidatus Uhrbacteria bacterium RIFCSPHIGHO2_02_FULL_60_10]
MGPEQEKRLRIYLQDVELTISRALAIIDGGEVELLTCQPPWAVFQVRPVSRRHLDAITLALSQESSLRRFGVQPRDVNSFAQSSLIRISVAYPPPANEEDSASDFNFSSGGSS